MNGKIAGLRAGSNPGECPGSASFVVTEPSQAPQRQITRAKTRECRDTVVGVRGPSRPSGRGGVVDDISMSESGQENSP